MDIACPNCAATYRVPDSLLARGAALRCAGCDHAWVPEVKVSVQVSGPVSVPPSEPQPLVEAPAPPEVAPPMEAEARPAAAPDLPPELQLPPPPEPLRANPLRASPPTTPPPLQRRQPAGLRPLERPAPPRRQAKAALRLAWLVSVMLVLLSVTALFVFGEQIAKAWPPFERVQALVRG